MSDGINASASMSSWSSGSALGRYLKVSSCPRTSAHASNLYLSGEVGIARIRLVDGALDQVDTDFPVIEVPDHTPLKAQGHPEYEKHVEGYNLTRTGDSGSTLVKIRSTHSRYAAECGGLDGRRTLMEAKPVAHTYIPAQSASNQLSAEVVSAQARILNFG